MKPDRKHIKDKPFLKPFESMLQGVCSSLIAVIATCLLVKLTPTFYVWADFYPYGILVAAYILCFIASLPLAKLYASRLNRPLISRQDMQDNYKSMPITTKLAFGVFGWGVPAGLLMATGSALDTGFYAINYVTQIMVWMVGGIVFFALTTLMDYALACFKKYILRKP